MSTYGYDEAVNCPSCRASDTKVVDSRLAEDGAAVRRRRECLSCSRRFTTFERVDHAPLTVIKSHGDAEPFDRAKVVQGLVAAAKGRDIGVERLEQVALEVEEAMRLLGSEVTSAAVGLAVLDRLRAVDEVAYLRFVSVYKHFDAAADFHRELELLEKTGP
jgi:transcriptional repressor NrdR